MPSVYISTTKIKEKKAKKERKKGRKVILDSIFNSPKKKIYNLTLLITYQKKKKEKKKQSFEFLQNPFTKLIFRSASKHFY